MKLGWSVKGIRPEARETAKEAARRAGMPLNEWLNSVIVNSAAEEGVDVDALDLDEDQYGGNDIATVNAKLDSLTRRLDRLARAPGSGPEAYAPRRLRDRLDQVAHLQHAQHAYAAPAPAYAPPPPPQPSGLDRAVAEIAARQRMLNGGGATPPAMPAAPAVVAPPRAPVPTQDLSGLEEQLHRITAQIETLRKPGVEEAIQALRGELAEMGHSVAEAMPRQVLDQIEKQIQGLTQRVAEGREAGVSNDVIGGIEHGIAEVRDALRTLTPAENLHGFQEALQELAAKIDYVVAQNDPATLQQLEHAIVTLRGVAGHIASNETVGELTHQVASLAEKVEHIANATAAGDALASLEHRINALSDALTERSQAGGPVPVGLEALVQSLTSKIEQLQASRGDAVAVGHLEDRILKLVEKLDASDSRLGNLEVLERGLADLLLHLEDLRAQKGDGGLRAGNMDGLKSDLARTQKSLDAVTGRLAEVVDRLANIEGGRHAAPAAAQPAPVAAEPPPVFGKLAVRPVPHQPPAAEHAPLPPAPPPMPSPPIAPRAAPIAPPAVQATLDAAPKPTRQFRHIEPIDPDLPPDQPLEPGSGPPRRPHPAARIAASEADLGPANPAEEPRGKSGFLSAARRAAKAAMQTAPKPLTQDDFNTPAAETGFAEDLPPQESMRSRILGKVKSVFISASVIAIVIGGLQIGSNYFDFWGVKDGQQAGRKSDTNVARETSLPPVETTASVRAPRQIGPVAAPTLPGMIPPSTTLGMSSPSPAVAPTMPDLPLTALGSVPRLVNPSTASSDVTGSISKAKTPGRNGVTPGKLPNEIGGPALRNAAAEGDANAAYEIGVRYAEGRGVAPNVEEAVRWLERAAHAGVAPAQFRLGSIYEKGQGVKKDLSRARTLYGQAAAKGNAKAMHNLAVLYAEGIEGKPDYTLAAQWFRKAASRGVADSQYNLGILCARGLGTEKSLSESYKWFALAAEAGDAEAGRKRDEVATRLDPKALSAAEQAFKTFKVEPQPATATVVPVPDGGWDKADNSAPAPRGKAKTPGAFEVGAR